MLAISLLPILAFGLLAFVPMLDGSDQDDPWEPHPEEPDDPDVGATFTSDENGVTIEFGEDETGTLAVFTYVDTEDDDENPVEIHEARYYLVPAGTEWPDNTSEESTNIPIPADYVDADGSYELADFEAAYGLELLGTVDLLAQGNDEPTDTGMADVLPELTANREAEYYYLEANTDGDELTYFLEEGFLVTRGGVTETIVTEDTTGTDDAEWLSTAVDGLTIDGGAGDDFIDGNALNSVLLGGEGNDEITANLGGASIQGGAGEDRIVAVDADVSGGEGTDRISLSGTDDNTAFGDEGDDFLSTIAEGSSALYGGADNDSLFAELSGNAIIDAAVFGGDGDDFIGIGNGATAEGGAGDDIIRLYAGATGFGGDGADTINMDGSATEGGTIIASGGAGADIFEVSYSNVDGELDSENFAQVEDFDLQEDVLRVTEDHNDDEAIGVNIVEDPDGAYSDVEIEFRNSFGESEIVTIRLTGVSGLTADDVQLP